MQQNYAILNYVIMDLTTREYVWSAQEPIAFTTDSNRAATWGSDTGAESYMKDLLKARPATYTILPIYRGPVQDNPCTSAQLMRALTLLHNATEGHITAIQFEDGTGMKFNYQVDGGKSRFIDLSDKL